MKDTFDKPPIRIDHEPTIGAPVIALGQRMPTRQAGQDMPTWAVAIQRRLDTIMRQQDEILYHLQHPWRVRLRRAQAAITKFWLRLMEY